MHWLGIVVLGLGVLAWSVRKIVSTQARSILSEKPQVTEVVGTKAAHAPGITEMLTELKRLRHPVARHRIYVQLLETAYRDRRNAVSRRLLLKQGDLYLSELESMLPALRAELGPEPEILPLKWMATTLEEDGRFEEALSICRQAEGWMLSDGTKTGFAGRRRRIDRNRQRAEGSAANS
ncbi:MAG: hypothetical protein V2B19_24750 [Pseudomonadota bacterium]